MRCAEVFGHTSVARRLGHNFADGHAEPGGVASSEAAGKPTPRSVGSVVLIRPSSDGRHGLGRSAWDHLQVPRCVFVDIRRAARVAVLLALAGCVSPVHSAARLAAPSTSAARRPADATRGLVLDRLWGSTDGALGDMTQSVSVSPDGSGWETVETVTGAEGPLFPISALVVSKYDLSSKREWRRQVPVVGSKSPAISEPGVAATSDGGVVVASAELSRQRSSVLSSLLIIRLSSTGAVLWRRTLAVTPGLRAAIAVDPADRVFVGGNTVGAKPFRGTVVGLRADGTPRWTHEWEDSSTISSIEYNRRTGGIVALLSSLDDARFAGTYSPADVVALASSGRQTWRGTAGPAGGKWLTEDARGVTEYLTDPRDRKQRQVLERISPSGIREPAIGLPSYARVDAVVHVRGGAIAIGTATASVPGIRQHTGQFILLGLRANGMVGAVVGGGSAIGREADAALLPNGELVIVGDAIGSSLFGAPLPSNEQFVATFSGA